MFRQQEEHSNKNEFLFGNFINALKSKTTRFSSLRFFLRNIRKEYQRKDN